MLSDRRQRVLGALIEEYISRAMPVGSRTLTERYHLGVSPATVRNDLSALEDAGYIAQPHTSAGRIPTDAGYRAFVDDLLASDMVAEDVFDRDMVAELRRSATELDELLERTSAVLTRLTDCLSVVIAPSLITGQIRQLSLISLTNHQALIVIVMESGRVLNRQVSFDGEVSPEELASVQNLLSRVFIGNSLAEIKAAYDKKTDEAFRSPLVRLILEEIIVCLSESNGGRSHRLGMSSLLQQPEFSSSRSLLPIMQVLEDDTVLLHVFDDAMESDADCVVRIGTENASESLAGVSVVAGQYGRGEGAGIVAVIGPTRMNYSRVIRAVRAARRALQDE